MVCMSNVITSFREGREIRPFPFDSTKRNASHGVWGILCTLPKREDELRISSAAISSGFAPAIRQYAQKEDRSFPVLFSLFGRREKNARERGATAPQRPRAFFLPYSSASIKLTM